MMLATLQANVMKRSPLDEVSDPSTHKKPRRERDADTAETSTRRTESPEVAPGAPYADGHPGGETYMAGPYPGPAAGPFHSPNTGDLTWLQPDPITQSEARRQDPSAYPPAGWHPYYQQMHYSPQRFGIWGEPARHHYHHAPAPPNAPPYYWSEPQIPPQHIQRHGMTMPEGVAPPLHPPGSAPIDAPSASYVQPSFSADDGDASALQQISRSTSNLSASSLAHGFHAPSSDSQREPVAATSAEIPEPSSENSTVVPLALPSDRESLSEFHILVRNQIDLFAAEQKDVDSSMQGRNRPIVLHQVGVRCRWCAARLPPSRRPRGAVYFPSKLSGLYQAAQNMTTNHFVASCQMIPMDIQTRLRELKEKKTYILGGGKGYWSTGGRIRGICEVDNRLFFEKSKPKASEVLDTDASK
mmetsp:Transcript_16242/g.44687  ORF Transcript_16242/g.44687 Transcript_16242/m.44687 type:complete len:414 (+) Transcript_16242:59-1300(+)